MSEPTITDAINPEYWANRGMVEFEAESAARVAKYTLRAVLREIGLGGNDPFRQSLMLLDIRDRIRAALGEET